MGYLTHEREEKVCVRVDSTRKHIFALGIYDSDSRRCLHSNMTASEVSRKIVGMHGLRTTTGHFSGRIAGREIYAPMRFLSNMSNFRQCWR